MAEIREVWAIIFEYSWTLASLFYYNELFAYGGEFNKKYKLYKFNLLIELQIILLLNIEIDV